MNEIHMPTALLSGVAEMDDQHDRLFNEIVQVKCALLEVAGDHADGLALLSRFAEDLDAHFAWEEEAARAKGIPFDEGHFKEHRKITAFVQAKVGEVSRGECNIPALMVFMERCFETHVAQYDLKLGHDLQAAHAPR
jgi:hemerythrin-like metal-binding protein